MFGEWRNTNLLFFFFSLLSFVPKLILFHSIDIYIYTTTSVLARARELNCPFYILDVERGGNRGGERVERIIHLMIDSTALPVPVLLFTRQRSGHSTEQYAKLPVIVINLHNCSAQAPPPQHPPTHPMMLKVMTWQAWHVRYDGALILIVGQSVKSVARVAYEPHGSSIVQ